jgi:peptide deformylase
MVAKIPSDWACPPPFDATQTERGRGSTLKQVHRTTVLATQSRIQGTRMAILKIARMGNPILLRNCDPVPDPGAPEIRRLVADMMQTMEDAPGVGLAGPQVYVPLRIFVFRVPGDRASADPNSRGVPSTVLINPEIEPIGEEIGLNWEGCLSIPDLRAVVPRALRIRYRGVDCDGNIIEGEASRFHARVIQHEYDHLDGILYPMRVTDFRYFGFNSELDRVAEAQRQQEAPQTETAP